MTAIGEEEKAAAMRVLDSGVLSGFLAGQLHGGPEVEALEQEWAEYFGFRHAVAMNSATSCLIAACGAIGLGRDDEVIVPPLTMSATATACLVYGAKPVFADIESEYFCLDPVSVSVKMNPATKAIITVDLFGQISNPALREVADRNGIPLIQDASQRPIPGGFGDIVVHSLNYHKHIHCGEGGIACTNDEDLARKLRLIRNHGENSEGFRSFGFNFRMTEIEAAIAREQLKKLPKEIHRRATLSKNIPDLGRTRPGYEHSYYLLPLTKSRHFPVEAGQPFRYARPLYSLSLFEEDPGGFPVTEKVWHSLRVLRP